MADFRDSVFYAMYQALVVEGTNHYDVEDIQELTYEETTSLDYAYLTHPSDPVLPDCLGGISMDGVGLVYHPIETSDEDD